MLQMKTKSSLSCCVFEMRSNFDFNRKCNIKKIKSTIVGGGSLASKTTDSNKNSSAPRHSDGNAMEFLRSSAENACVFIQVGKNNAEILLGHTYICIESHSLQVNIVAIER